jgi:hypothetical protein
MSRYVGESATSVSVGKRPSRVPVSARSARTFSIVVPARSAIDRDVLELCDRARYLTGLPDVLLDRPLDQRGIAETGDAPDRRSLI